MSDGNSSSSSIVDQSGSSSSSNGQSLKRVVVDNDDKIVSSFSDSLDINQLRDEDMRVIADLYPTSVVGIEQSELFIGMDSIGESMDMIQ